MDRPLIARALSSPDRTRRGLRRALGAVAVTVALQLAAGGCLTASRDTASLDAPAPAERRPAIRTTTLTSTDLRMAGPGSTLHSALLSMQPDLMQGRDPFTRIAGARPPTVYVNGFRAHDIDALRDIAVSSVRRVEIVPPYAERRARGSPYQPGSIHVTLHRKR